MSKDRTEEIINKKGLFVVKAGPGSGKTTAVAKRLAYMLSDWEFNHRGIASISFTNVAWQEIEKYLSKNTDVKIPISYPHFLGTIDSFINQYIFLPFGHLVMGCKTRPILVGKPYGAWFGKRLDAQFDNFSYNISGELFAETSERAPKNWKSNFNIKNAIRKMKERLNKSSYATQLDANYFAMKILEEYPKIAKALSYRFPVMMIDEAQDTSEIQMKIIEILIENGLNEVMLIGDADQSIYEWRTANPRLFLKKYKEWRENSLELVCNYRSSQKICNFFSKISSFDNIPESNSEFKDFGFTPQIWGYSNQNYNEVIEDFLKLCKDNNITLNSKDVAILSRSKNFLSDIRGVKINNRKVNPWKDLNSKNIAKSKYLFDRGDYKDAFHLLEKAVCSIKNNKNFCTNEELESVIKEYGFIQWRKEIYNLIQLLPDTKLKLGEWKEQSNKKLEENNSVISEMNFQLNIKRNSAKYKYSEMEFDKIFSKEEVRINENKYTIGTVHSVKGETFKGVLLFVKENRGNRKKYEDILNSRIEDNEELRIIYVAITRPSKILVIAMSEGDKNVWKSKFFSGVT